MSEIKKKSRSFRKLMLAASAGLAAAGTSNYGILAAVGFAAAGVSNHVMANQYFDLNGSNAAFGTFSNTTFSWDTADWNSSSAGTNATTAFVAGSAAFFNGTGATNYIVTVAATESDAGIFMTGGIANLTVNINQSGTGNLSIASGFQGFDISTGSDTLVINAPMTGSGGIQEQGSGQIALYGNNTFSGGYETTGGQVTNYNNANSFGTGKIFITGSGGGAFVSAATSQVTIANAWSFTNATTTTLTNFNGTGTLASPGVIFSGAVALPTVAADTVSFQTGPLNTVTEFSGAITGTALVGLTITANASTNGYGTIILAGADTYSGTTTITNGTNGGTAVTLAAGAVNALSAKSAFTDNSILNLQGFNQTIGSLAGSGTVQLGSVTAALLTVGSNNGTTSFTGLISGTGSGGGLTKIGTGTFTLNKANGDTYLGPTTVTTGTLAAGAANSFAPNSDFTVNATLNLAGFAQVIGSLSGTGTVSLGAATDGILSVGSNGSSTTFSGNISGTGTGGGLTKIGTGTFTLATTGGEVYNGPTAVNGGVLAASASNVLSTASALTVAAAGTVSLGGFDQTMGSLAGAGIVNLGDTTAANLTVGGNNTSTTFSGSITGTGTGGSLIKAGTGIFSMTGTNGSIFLGDTTINAGTLSIVQDNDLGANGTGNVTIGAASLLGAGNFSTDRLIHLNDPASTLDASTGKTFEIDSVIDGTGGLTKGTNAGIVLLTSNANIYAGNTTINGGTLAIDDDGSLGASGGTVTINAGTLLAASNVASARPIIVNRTNSTVDATGGNTFTITGNISGTGSLTKGTNLGTVLLNNTGGDLYTGATTVNGGVLAVGGSNTLPSATAVTVNAAGTLSLTGFDQTIGSLTGAGTVNLGDITAANLTTGGNNTSTTFSGSITGTGTGGGLFKVGTGTFALTSTNGSTFLTDTTISGGTLSIVQDNDLGGNPTGNVNIGAATLLANGNILTTRTINLNDPASTIDAATGDTLLLNGLVAGSGGFTKGTNASTIVLSQSSNTYGGDTTINGGTLVIAGDGSLGTNTAGNVNIGAATLLASGNIPTARTINLNNAASTVDAVGGDTLSLNGLVAGSGALNKGTNASTVLLSGTANTYLGNTTVNGGTLGIAADGSLGAAGGTVNLGAATLLATSSIATARNLNLTSTASTVDVGSGNTFTLGGVIGGSGSLNTGTSGGIIVLSGTANTYLGNTTVNGDTLAVGADGSLGAGSTVNIGAGTLQATGSFTTARNVNLTDPASTIDVTAGNTLAVGGIVGGSGALNTGTSGGTLNLTGVGNTYAGNTTINSGVLEIAADGSLGAGGTVNVGAGTLLAAGNVNTARNINLTGPAGGSVLDALGGDTMVITGSVNDSGNGLNKGTNAGTVQLASTNSVSIASISVSGGELSFAANTTVTGTSAATVASGATLDVTLATLTAGDINNNGTFQLSQTGSNGGAATIGNLLGSGTTVINQYASLSTAGGTQNTLTMLGGTLALRSSDLTVSNATLDGGATLVGSATNGLGAPSGPGLDVTGTLSLPNSVNLQAGVELNLSGSASVSNPAAIAGDANTAFNILSTGTLTYTGGTNTLSLDATTNVNGTVNANTGTIYMSNGGVQNGTFNVASNGTMFGTGHFTAGSVVNDNGVFTLGTLTGTAANFDGTLNVNPGATLGLQGVSTVSGSATVNFTAGDSLTTFVSASASFFNNQVLNIGNASLNGSITFRNAGVSIGNLTYGDGTLSPQVLAFETGGTVNIGTATQNGNVLSSGTFEGFPTTLDIGTYTVGPNSIVRGNINISTAMNWSGAILDGGDGTLTTVTIEPGATLTTDGTGQLERGAVLINLGNLVATNGLTVGMLTGSTTAQLNLQGSSTATVGGVLQVGTGGLLTGGAQQAELNITDNASLVAAILSLNSGQLHVTGQGQASLDGLNVNDAIIDSGTVTISSTPAAGEDPVIAGAIVGGYQHDGAMFVNGGLVTTPVMNLGVTPGMTGTFVQTGGTVTVSSALLVGQSGGGNGSMTISGGNFTVTGGTALVDTNGLLNVTGGTFTAPNLSGAGMTSVGGGSGAATMNLLALSQGTVTVGSGGLLNLGSTPVYTNTANGPVVLSGGLASSVNISGALTINGGGQVLLNPTAPGLGQTHSVGTLAIGAGSSMDIGNHTVIVQNAPDETVIGGYLSNGYAAGFWNGTSATGGVIKSVVAFNDNSGATSIGYGNSADFTFVGSTSPYAVGGPKALSGNQVVVAPALAGDLLLSGTVGPNELALMLGTFGTTGNDWAQGNIDYDAAGSVGPNDLSLLLSNFGQSSAGFASAKPAAKSLTSTAKPSLVASASDVTPPPADGIELIVNFQSGDVEIEGNNATVGTSIVLTSAANGLVGGTTFTPAFSALFNTSASNTNGLIDEFNTFTNGSAVNGIVDMGDIYNTIQNSGDIQFQFSEKGINRGGLQTGSVTYVGVPEPTTMTLLAVASAGLLGRRRRKAQRQD